MRALDPRGRWEAAVALGPRTGGVGLATGWARIYLGLHFPLDILGASAIAGVAAALLTAFGTGWTGPLRRSLERMEPRLAQVLHPLGRRTGQNGRG
jgi:undecaprenyl-diphosphatase